MVSVVVSPTLVVPPKVLWLRPQIMVIIVPIVIVGIVSIVIVVPIIPSVLV